MNKQLKIKKWWWENAAEFKKSPQNILNDFIEWNKQVVVVSAIRSPEFNTTDNLIKLAVFLINWENKEAYEQILKIRDFHIWIMKEKIWENKEIENFIENYIKANLSIKINNWINLNSKDKIYPNKNNDYSIWNWEEKFSLIGFGEELSAFLQEKLINQLNINWLKAEKVDLDWVADVLEKDDKENVIFEKLSNEITKRVSKILKKNNIPVISWYIPWFENGIENIIWRWYTDATASIVSIWFANTNDVILEIQKSVEWILSADPRIVKNPKLIKSLDYLTAKEITWVRGSQAKLLHSQVLRKELLEKWIRIKLFDPFSDTEWTIISRNKNPESSWVEYIWARNNVIFFSISSWDMSNSGILAQVFDVTRKYNISVDIVSTSETEISFTIDNWISTKILDKISENIRENLEIKENDSMNFVKYEKNKVLLFCVGQNLAHSTGSLARATSALSSENINIKIMSQWAMERSMVFWIDNSDMKNAVNVLHNEFILKNSVN